MPEDSRISINRFFVDKFVESDYHQQHPQISLTQLCNSLLEKFLSGEVVELTGDNFTAVKQCADSLQKQSSFVVNSVLEKIDLTPIVKPEKIKVEVTPHKQTVKINKKTNLNKVSNW